MPTTKTIFAGTPDSDTLGNRILRARESGDLSSGELARRLGVKKSTVDAWESDRSEPRANHVIRIAGMLGVSPAWLLGGIGDAPPDDVVSAEIRIIRHQIDQIRQMRDATDNAISIIERALEKLASKDKA